jgi:hypothetical protein
MKERLNALDRLIETKTETRGFDEFASVHCKKTGEIKDYTSDKNEEYVITLALRVNFWANQAQYNEARQFAEKVLVAKLYHEILGDLSELRLQISNGHRYEAMKICNSIESKLC